ncbi:MAG: LytTR family DNA-binding domain-containing protein [Bacteroidia bacterium]|nr:LytTR family DNA-binding domain-containing protein [Bacteroidia bacterium]
MKIRAIAIDDEPLGLEVIRHFAPKIPFLDLVATFQNPLEGVQYLGQEPVELIFLDIQMPDLTGIQLLKTISVQPVIIFTTAYPQYAVDSYELSAVDYLLKPFLFERFLKAVNKAQAQLIAQGRLEDTGIPETGGQKDYMFVKSDTRYFRVNYSDILFIEGMRDYIAVHTPRQRILTLMSMTDMLKKLPAGDFMRVHKSYIAGIKHVTLIQNNRILIGEREIPISNTYREDIQRFIEDQSR